MSAETYAALAAARAVYAEIRAMSPSAATTKSAKKAFARIERAHVRDIQRERRARARLWADHPEASR